MNRSAERELGAPIAVHGPNVRSELEVGAPHEDALRTEDRPRSGVWATDPRAARIQSFQWHSGGTARSNLSR
jgi:hypothetical protein